MNRLLEAFKTDTGRDPGEKGDAFLCGDQLFIVVEGLGGNHLTEIAEEVACRAIYDGFFRILREVHSPAEALVLALEEANRGIILERKRTGLKIAASVSVVYVMDDIMYFTHLGDSRIYSIHGGEIAQITRDHTVQEEDPYVEPGYDDPRLMRALTEGLGIHEKPDIRVKKFALHHRDLIIMTTEGLTSRLPNKEILRLTQKEKGVERLRDTLIETARKRGGEREMTVGVIRFEKRSSGSWKRPLTYGSAALLLLLLVLGGYALLNNGDAPTRVEIGGKVVERKEPAKPGVSEQVREIARAPVPVKEAPGKQKTPHKTMKESPTTVEEVLSFLSRWRGAWENTAAGRGGLDDYMACYSEAFTSKGFDKRGWRRDKAKKGGTKKWIAVELSDVRVKGLPGDDRIEVSFNQMYRSSNYSGSSRKVLLVRKEETGWKIIVEKTG